MRMKACYETEPKQYPQVFELVICIIDVMEARSTWIILKAFTCGDPQRELRGPWKWQFDRLSSLLNEK